MGQYGNQPDFGTILEPLSAYNFEVNFPPSAIYIGETEDGTACSIAILPVGDTSRTVEITGIQPGTFLPIIAVQIVSAFNIDKEDIILYR
jgi:hypothetical protein